MKSYAAVKIRIADELERYLDVARWLREALENEMNSSFGVGKNGEPPKCGVDKTLTQKWKDAVSSFVDLSDAKIRLDKNAKLLADTMSAEDEREAVRLYIRSVPPTERRHFLREEMEWLESNSAK